MGGHDDDFCYSGGGAYLVYLQPLLLQNCNRPLASNKGMVPYLLLRRSISDHYLSNCKNVTCSNCDPIY